jgi:hypothetical protein
MSYLSNIVIPNISNLLNMFGFVEAIHCLHKLVIPRFKELLKENAPGTGRRSGLERVAYAAFVKDWIW